MADMTFKANLIPASNNYYNLGTATGAINKFWRLAVNNIASVPSTNQFGGICFTDSNTAVLSKINTSPFINIRLQSNNWCAIELGKPREYSGFLHLWHKSSDYSTILYPKAPSTTQVQIQLPDESGLVALTNSANSGYVLKTGDTMTGQLYINYDQDVGLNQNGSLIIGNKTGENIAIDGNEIMARKNGAASALTLNAEGGIVAIGGQSTNTICYGNLETRRTTYSDGASYIRLVSNNKTIGIHVGAGGGNRGLYDWSVNNWIIYCDGTNAHSPMKLYGAVWNDYAEMRNVPEAQKLIKITKNKDDEDIRDYPLSGRCVREVGDGTMVLSTSRLERGCKVISDTFGFNIGETDSCKTPIAVSGRALAYLNEGREIAKTHIGWPVCSGPNGTVSIMTEEEEAKYPSRIVGTISEIPEYETWGSGNVPVDGRIWIYVR